MSKNIAKNTYVDFELETGETVKLTLTFIALLELKEKHLDQYNEYSRIMMKGAKDELENLTVIYTAYLCALIMKDGDTDNAMDYEEFLTSVTPDREYLGTTLAKLVAPKKATASANHS